MMPSLVAMVLCVAASAAAAQCVTPAAQAAAPSPGAPQVSRPGGAERIQRHGAELVKTKADAAAVRETPSLISTAAAQEATAPQRAPLASSEAAGAAPAADRDDSALLLAALALMCGIALRRNNTGSR